VEESFERAPKTGYNRDQCLKVLQDFNQRMVNEVIQMKKDFLSDDEAYSQLDQLIPELTVSYEEYVALRDSAQCPQMLKKYFTPQNFLSLARDEKGNIGKEDFMRFIQRTADVEATTVGLLRHTVCDESASDPGSDAEGSWGVKGVSGKDGSIGFISEQELERYVFELIPTIPGCRELDFRFFPFYVYTATRYFLFYLDPHHTKRISIKKLSHSYVMEELLFFKRATSSSAFDDNNNSSSPLTAAAAAGSGSPSTFASQMGTNWFDGKNAEKLYNTYIDLDFDGNGTLNQEELFHFTGVKENENVQLSKVVIRRIFEETIAYRPAEMDYKGFLDLVIALDNKSSVESMSYFWKILDVDKTGRLGPDIIQMFYRDVYESLTANGYDAPSLSNVVVEIYDLLGCSDSRGPTFKDLIRSGQGHIAIAMLTDETGFWNYDNRENLMAQGSNSNVPR
jgi:Ca2+-binding EF-hand superfamily protein